MMTGDIELVASALLKVKPHWEPSFVDGKRFNWFLNIYKRQLFQWRLDVDAIVDVFQHFENFDLVKFHAIVEWEDDDLCK